jgi:DNA-binding GntR family transcriptional regulator
MEVLAVSVADAAADQLRRRLLSGHYRGGEQLRDTAFTGLGNDVSWDVVHLSFHRSVFVAAGSARLLPRFDEVGAELRLLIAQLRSAHASVANLAHEHELLLVALSSGNPRAGRRPLGRSTSTNPGDSSSN